MANQLLATVRCVADPVFGFRRLLLATLYGGVAADWARDWFY